jgi:hypothetical protein
MACQSGQVGPLIYNQDNSGTSTDITTNVQYTAQEFGAPPGAQILPYGNPSVSIHRGSAQVRDVVITPDAYTFEVWTQAADDGLFGHHSGAITVSTTFFWYSE